MPNLSIVIPTYNRGEQLGEVIEHILKSDVNGLAFVEILIVDDGSQIPPHKFISQNIIKSPFSLRIINQYNAGPAAARNNGFRNAKHSIVLFMDDDILAFPDMIQKHIEGHREYPGSVIYGYCPYAIPKKETPAYQFLKQLAYENEKDGKNNGFIPTTSIASGNISVEKNIFPDGEFYKSFLRTPAAEEFELMARLTQLNVKIYFNSSIRGWHLQPVTIQDKCKQEYKYGIGVAEVAIKVTYSLDHVNLQCLYYNNRKIMRTDTWRLKLKKCVKSILSKKLNRQLLLGMVKGMESVLPFNRILFPFYRLLAGVFVFAGVREGIKKFNNPGGAK
ncbi:MAG: glycosyltransferase family 2 protein [Chitinophagaceae bacterium]|nr:glycosyltransferase family 2 protein [Chitinophagaceae bacterium]